MKEKKNGTNHDIVTTAKSYKDKERGRRSRAGDHSHRMETGKDEQRKCGNCESGKYGGRIRKERPA